MSKRFLIILVALIAGFFGILVFTKNKADAPESTGDTTNSIPAHTYGNGKKSVKLVEYGDFQCPACAGYFPILSQIKEKYKEDITFEFKHLPLSEIHPHAVLASRATVAASLQNKFWEMHDLMYANQRSWSDMTDPMPIFEQYATQLSLDVEKFKTDLKSDEVNRRVNADRNEAKSKGYNGTPSFELDGKALDNTRADLDYFSKIIDEAIAAKNPQQ